MTAIYKMEQNPPKKGSGKKVVLHPRIIPLGYSEYRSFNRGSVFAIHLY